jgi:hypothetical protein
VILAGAIPPKLHFATTATVDGTEPVGQRDLLNAAMQKTALLRQLCLNRMAELHKMHRNCSGETPDNLRFLLSFSENRR